MEDSIVEKMKEIIGIENGEIVIPQIIKNTLDEMIQIGNELNSRKTFGFEACVPEIRVEISKDGDPYLVYENEAFDRINILKAGIKYEPLRGMKAKDTAFERILKRQIKQKIIGLIINKETEKIRVKIISRENKKKSDLQEQLAKNEISQAEYLLELQKIENIKNNELNMLREKSRDRYEETIEKLRLNEPDYLVEKANDVYNEKDWIQIILDNYKQTLQEKKLPDDDNEER